MHPDKSTHIKCHYCCNRNNTTALTDFIRRYTAGPTKKNMDIPRQITATRPLLLVQDIN